MPKITGKIVVTGGAGFIGSHLVDALLVEGCDVVVLDNLESGTQENINTKARFVEGSITEKDVVMDVCKGADYVFHQAAIPSVQYSITNPLETHEVNVTGTLNVLLAAKECGVKRVVYASSAAVYGESAALPKTEAMPREPMSPYALHKAVNENYATLFAKVYGVESVGLRYFNVFGPRQDPKSPYAGALAIFVEKMKRGDAPIVFGDGSATRDFVYVRDVVRANILAAVSEKAVGKVYNVATNKATSISRTIEILNNILGTDLTPIYEDFRAGDIKHSAADISRAKKDLGYDPQVSFEEGLRRLVDESK